jgi:hypothetical protein
MEYDRDKYLEIFTILHDGDRQPYQAGHEQYEYYNVNMVDFISDIKILATWNIKEFRNIYYNVSSPARGKSVLKKLMESEFHLLYLQILPHYSRKTYLQVFETLHNIDGPAPPPNHKDYINYYNNRMADFMSDMKDLKIKNKINKLTNIYYEIGHKLRGKSVLKEKMESEFSTIIPKKPFFQKYLKYKQKYTELKIQNELNKNI